MLGIQINSDFLDLAPGTKLEMERENPILQFNQEIKGGYSLPVEALDTDHNAALLDYAGLIQKNIESAGTDAQIFDNGIPTISGKLKIERTKPNLNKQWATGISCYLLTDSGDFFQEIKDKKLRDINAGGVRSFAWDGLTIISGAGFWRHIHDVANGAVNAYDYAFYPVINKGWPVGDVIPEIMNMMYYDGGIAHFPTTYVPLAVREVNRIVPMPYLHYILKKAFEYVGWKLQGEILTDATFLKCTLINFRAINWADVHVNSGTSNYTAHNPVEFDLKDHLPDIGIGEFLIALKNRFGWWFDFNKTSKVCTIKMLKDIPGLAAKDITTMANPVLQKTIYQDRKVYALRNGIDAPDFAKIDYMGMVGTTGTLPAASQALNGEVYFVKSENNYYICEQQDDESWAWVIFVSNVYDFAPAGANEDITTSSTVPDMEYWSSYLSLLPRIDNQGEWDGRNDEPAVWGIHLALFHGMQPNITNDAYYPYASPHVLNSHFELVAAWGLSYTAYDVGGTDCGIYVTFWKDFLDMLNVKEEIELTCYLPFDQYMNLLWTDQLVVAGVKMFIKTLKPVIPYNDELKMTCVRI